MSSTVTVGAGTPQGTVSGPNDFKLVINDLTFNTIGLLMSNMLMIRLFFLYQKIQMMAHFKFVQTICLTGRKSMG